MILFVACTGPPFGTSVAELVIEEREVEDEFVYAVEPEIWLLLDAWLMVWAKPGRLPAPFERVLKIGAVFVLERGPWADMATPDVRAAAEDPAFKRSC
jgi:hypothetical protein